MASYAERNKRLTSYSFMSPKVYTKTSIKNKEWCLEVLPVVVVPTCTDEECDQKPQLSCSKAAWRLLVRNMPEDTPMRY